MPPNHSMGFSSYEWRDGWLFNPGTFADNDVSAFSKQSGLKIVFCYPVSRIYLQLNST